MADDKARLLLPDAADGTTGGDGAHRRHPSSANGHGAQPFLHHHHNPNDSPPSYGSVVDHRHHRDNHNHNDDHQNTLYNDNDSDGGFNPSSSGRYRSDGGASDGGGGGGEGGQGGGDASPSQYYRRSSASSFGNGNMSPIPESSGKSFEGSGLMTQKPPHEPPYSPPASSEAGGGGGGGGGGVPPGTSAAAAAPAGMSPHMVVRARIISALVLTVYFASTIGSSPLSSQYVYLRLYPDYVNDSDSGGDDNSTVDFSPCTANASDPRVEASGNLQAAVSQKLLYFSLAGTAPMILGSVLLGCYSDVFGRKFLFLIPVVANFLKLSAVAVIIKLQLSLDYFYLINVLEGFSGSFAGVLLATYAYTADLTAPAKSRTLAIAILEACLALAGAAADVGVGYLIQYINYFYAAVLMVSLAAVPIGLVIALPETIRKGSTSSDPGGRISTETSTSRNPLKYVRNIFGFYFTAGSARRRAQFLVALAALSVSLISFLGAVGVSVLYQMNAPFCWGSTDIGIYGGVNVMVRAIGSVVSVHLLQRYLSDASIAAITLLTGAASNVVYGLASKPYMLYLSVVVGVTSNAALPVTRAILSKLAGPSKQGALFASIAVSETLCSLLSSTLYNTIYQATVETARGTVYYSMAGVIVINFLIIMVFIRISRGHSLVSEEFEANVSADIQHNKPNLDQGEVSSKG